MILGIGLDLIDCRRITKVIERQGQRFLERVFTLDEQKRCQNKYHSSQSFGKVYAAKEAVVKAIGNVQGIHWKHIEIRHFFNGRPCVNLKDRALHNFKDLIPLGMKGKIDLSIADEPPYAQAFVIISAIPFQKPDF